MTTQKTAAACYYAAVHKHLMACNTNFGFTLWTRHSLTPHILKFYELAAIYPDIPENPERSARNLMTLILKTAVGFRYPVDGSNLRPSAGFKMGSIFL